MSAASILLHSGASVSAASASVAASVAGAAYLVAALLFILSLHGLSKHETARRGVLFGVGGMVIAIAATIWLTVEQLWGQPQATIGLTLLVVAVLIGGSIGLWRARVVEMTGMPELIALLHSFVGLAAVIVGWNGALDDPSKYPRICPGQELSVAVIQTVISLVKEVADAQIV